MGLLAEARSKTQARQSEGISPNQSVGLLAEARAIKTPSAPVETIEPAQAQPTAIGRTGRVQRRALQEDTTAQQLAQLEAGQITSADLSPQEVERVRKARLAAIPEIGQAGLGVDPDIATGAVGLTTLDPAEFGRILSNQFPQIGIVTTPEGEQIAVNNETGATASLNKPGISPVDIMQGLGVVAAFTPGARLAGTAPKLTGQLIGREVAAPKAIRAGAQALGAAGTEAVIQAGQEAAGGEFDAEDVALAGGLGIAGEVVPGAAQAAGQRIRAAVGGAEETVEQSARRSLLEQEGLEPTRAQVTREASEFQSQQEAAKTSGPVRSRIEQQEARLQGAFEQRALDTEGNVITSTSTPIDEVLERSITQDEQIGALYQQARDIAPDAKDIRLNSLTSKLKGLTGEERISGGLISSVRNDLQTRGIINEKGDVVGRISVDVAEQIRQDINLLHNSLTDRGRQLSRQLKESLDEDVFRQSGGDLFDRARSSKREFEQGLDRAKISKFDSRKDNLVRDILDNKISPDTFVNDVVFAKKWRTEDLNQLRSYLNQTPSGKQAWNDLRAQTIDEIKTKSFTGPVREDGVTKSLSRNALDKTLDKLGAKTNILFNTQERQFFKRIQEVAKLREPTPGTFTGKGPSAQAISQAKTRFPIIGPIIDSLSEFRQNRLLLKLPKQKRAPRKKVKVPPQSAQALRTDEE